MVYRAEDHSLNRIVAIKRLKGSVESQAYKNSYHRFLREAQSLCRLRHKNIVSIYHMGLFLEETPYLVMEYVPGRSLSKLFKELGPLAWPRSLQIVQQICAGLEAAHKAGVIHRDIKPDNILLTDEAGMDIAKIVDFGLCSLLRDDMEQLTQTGFLIGTAPYMAPEIAEAKKISTAVDVYAVACLLHELLTGRQLFESDSAPGIVYKHCHEPPPLVRDRIPDYPWPNLLEQLLQRALEKNAASRPSLAELSRLCQELLDEASDAVRAPLPSLPASLETKERKRSQSRSCRLIRLPRALYLASALSVCAVLFALLLTSPSGSKFLLLHFPACLPESRLLSATELCMKDFQKEGRRREFERVCDFWTKRLKQGLTTRDHSRLYACLQQSVATFHDDYRAREAVLNDLAERSHALKLLRSRHSQEKTLDTLILATGDICK